MGFYFKWSAKKVKKISGQHSLEKLRAIHKKCSKPELKQIKALFKKQCRSVMPGLSPSINIVLFTFTLLYVWWLMQDYLNLLTWLASLRHFRTYPDSGSLTFSKTGLEKLISVLWILYFSSHQNRAICNTRHHSKCTWTPKDSLWEDHETCAATCGKERQEYWWYYNNGWFHCCWCLVWEEATCELPSWFLKLQFTAFKTFLAHDMVKELIDKEHNVLVKLC